AADDVELDYGTSAETVTVTDSGTANMTTVSSTAGEATTFANPARTLTIKGGSEAAGGDAINVNSLGSGFNAALTIDGGEGTDTITLDAALSLGSAASAGSVSFTAEAITLNANIATNAGTNAGDVGLTGAVTLGADVTLSTDASGGDGNITIGGTTDADAAASNRNLTLTAGGGSVSLTGAVG